MMPRITTPTPINMINASFAYFEMVDCPSLPGVMPDELEYVGAVVVDVPPAPPVELPAAKMEPKTEPALKTFPAPPPPAL